MTTLDFAVLDTLIRAEEDLERIKSICHDVPEIATSLERGLMTAALLAIDSGDVARAQMLAKIALDAQQIPFRRM